MEILDAGKWVHVKLPTNIAGVDIEYGDLSGDQTSFTIPAIYVVDDGGKYNYKFAAMNTQFYMCRGSDINMYVPEATIDHYYYPGIGQEVHHKMTLFKPSIGHPYKYIYNIHVTHKMGVAKDCKLKENVRESNYLILYSERWDVFFFNKTFCTELDATGVLAFCSEGS